MKPYFESVFLPGEPFPVRGLITTTMEHVIKVHPHWHAETEVLYYMEGSALQQVNDSIFTAVAGDIIIIGRDQLHSTYTMGSNDCRILVLQFDANSMLAQIVNNHVTLPEVDFNNGTVYKNPIRTDDDRGRLLLQCINEIYDELSIKGISSQYMVRAALYRLTGLLNRHNLFTVSPDNTDSVRNAHLMLERTFKLVDESFMSEISLNQAALASNLSTTHFCRLFKKTTGMTFHEYLTFYRINRAEKMLNSTKKLTEIAFDCGFGSVSSFIRNFKSVKGCTPSNHVQEGEA